MMEIKTYKTGIVGRWIGISWFYANRTIGIGFWFRVIEIRLEAKVRGDK